MTTPHKHAELIKAWADGAIIQSKAYHGSLWVDNLTPSWLTTSEYRV